MIGDILQPTHLLLILAVALLVLGPKRLPEVGRQLGSGLRDFRSAINGDRDERQDEVRSVVAAPTPAVPASPPATSASAETADGVSSGGVSSAAPSAPGFAYDPAPGTESQSEPVT